ncbi:MAG: hypothetical protein HY935_02580 [Nitrosomonadales bacterium]|nr:hypothetical protein [Nitrosomonadales bacterium]
MKSISAFSGVQLKWPAVLAGVFCLSLAAVASAEAGGRPCADDAAKLCKDVQKGEGRVAKCLKEHKDELSPACKKRVAKAKERAKEMKEECHEDAKKLCKDIQPGGGRIMQCLKQHEGELSPACKENMARPGHRK